MKIMGKLIAYFCTNWELRKYLMKRAGGFFNGRLPQRNFSHLRLSFALILLNFYQSQNYQL